MDKLELEQCIQEYGRDIYSFCKHLTCNVQDADELYQDTFLKAVELHWKIDGQDNPKSYLLSIAVHLWKNRRRKAAWRNRIASVASLTEEQEENLTGGVEISPEEIYLVNEEMQIVRSAVDKLPQKLKVCVLLFYMEDLSVAQVAKTLKLPEGTVKRRLYQARKLLEKELENVL